MTTASQSYNLQLGGTYAAGANVDLISDSHGGTDLFLDGSNSTISTGTTNATAVAISGDFVNTNSAPVYIYEQTVSGTASKTNSVLIGLCSSASRRTS